MRSLKPSPLPMGFRVTALFKSLLIIWEKSGFQHSTVPPAITMIALKGLFDPIRLKPYSTLQFRIVITDIGLVQTGDSTYLERMNFMLRKLNLSECSPTGLLPTVKD